MNHPTLLELIQNFTGNLTVEEKLILSFEFEKLQEAGILPEKTLLRQSAKAILGKKMEDMEVYVAKEIVYTIWKEAFNRVYGDNP